MKFLMRTDFGYFVKEITAKAVTLVKDEQGAKIFESELLWGMRAWHTAQHDHGDLKLCPVYKVNGVL